MKSKISLSLVTLVCIICCALGFTACTKTPTEGLQFTQTGSSCAVSGIGTATDTDIIIPSEYNSARVTKIADSAFDGCTSIKSVTIPEGVEVIGSYAFQNCTSLKSVKLPDSVTELGGSAFYGCSSLESIDIPASVTKIGNFAFRGCSALKSIDIPDGIESIEAYTFYGCTALASITIPASVTYINGNAFKDCPALTDIKFEGTKAQWEGVSKIVGWDQVTSNYTITCTDGTMSK